MNEYIEREKVYHKLTGVCDGYCHAKMCKFTEYMLEEIEDIPAADVQPVKRGKWELIDKQEDEWIPTYVCSECSKSIVTYKCNYCPNCGADMRGEDNAESKR